MRTYMGMIGAGIFVAIAVGCNPGDTPTANAPAARGANGVPVLSDEQMSKLSPDKRAQLEQSQAALQQAAAANQQRRQTGRMPGGG